MAISYTDASWRLSFRVDAGFDDSEHGYHGQTYGIALGDIDSDGWLDLYANHHLVSPSEILYGFGRGSEAVKSVRLKLGEDDQHGPVFFDIDHDGDIDLLEAVGAGQGSVSNPDNPNFWNKVLLNEGGRITSKDIARDLGLDYGPSRARTMVPLELDGKTGVFLGSEGREDDTWPGVIMVQKGDGSFKVWGKSKAISYDRFAIGARLTDDEATDFVFANFASVRIIERNGSKTRKATIDAGEFDDITDLVVADFDGDLSPEIFLGQLGGRRDKLLDRGGDGVWRDQAWASGITGLATVTASAVAGDFDNDGDQDIAALQRAEGVDLVFWVNDGSGHFSYEQITRPDLPGTGSTLAVGDVNNDGVLDLIAATGEGEPIEENAGGYFLFEGKDTGNNWLSIALKGTVSETNGLGARVYVRTADGREQVLEQDSGAHFSAQDDTRLHFGLGDHDSAKVRVVWADGTVQQLGNLKANKHMTVVEDRSDSGRSDDDTPLDVSLSGKGDRYVAATGDDQVVRGLKGNDKIKTKSGDDKLFGGTGNDDLRSGGGDDTIKGGEGNDRILGGPGSDRLKGDGGRDVFIFRSKDVAAGETEFDTITGFNWRDDKILLKGFDTDTFGGVDFSFHKSRPLISIDDEQHIWLNTLKNYDKFFDHDLIDFA